MRWARWWILWFLSQMTAIDLQWPEIRKALEDLPILNTSDEWAEFYVLDLAGSPVRFYFHGQRVSFAGRSAHFEPKCLVWQCAAHLKLRLDARVFDDCGGYLFETIESLNDLEPV